MDLDYVLDISFGRPYAFCPFYEPGEVVVGLSIIANKCPGNLVGVYHADGQEAADQWIENNPDWHEQYRA